MVAVRAAGWQTCTHPHCWPCCSSHCHPVGSGGGGGGGVRPGGAVSSEVTPLGDGLSLHTPKPSTLSSRSTGHLLQDAYLGLSRWKPGSL